MVAVQISSKPLLLKCIYLHKHIVSAMRKSIALSEKAYETLKCEKKPGESFSDVILRIASEEKKTIMDCSTQAQ